MTTVKGMLRCGSAVGLLIAAPAMAQTAPAAAQADTSTNLDAPTDSNTVVVTGIRESLKSSLKVKRDANAVVDVITAEGIGKFPDRNIAESLSHLPGVSVDHQFGEGEKVSIQGTDPALNRILIDGHTIASADWGGNPNDPTGRTFNYSLLAPEIVSRIEVYKSPEPRIDEGSLGGTVIVRTRKPLDVDANTITGSFGYSYNDRSDKGNPRGSLLYSWHNEAGTFGVLVAGTYDKQSLTRAGIEYFGYSTGADFLNKAADGSYSLKNPNATITGGTVNDLAKARYPYGINYDYFEQTRERIGSQAAIQFKPTDRLSFALTGLYIHANYNNFSQAEYVVPAWASSQLQSATVSNGLVTAASFGATTRPSTSAELDNNFRKTTVQNGSVNLAGEWKGDHLTIAANGGYTKATGGTNPEYLFNVQSSMPFSFAYSQNSTNVNYQTAPTNAANWSRTDVSARTDGNGNPITGYQIGGIGRNRTTDDEKYGQIDLTAPIEDSFVTNIRLGAKYSDHDNRADVFGSQVYYTTPVTLSQLNPVNSPSGLFNGLGASGNATQFATLTPDTIVSALKNGTFIDTGRDSSSSFDVREKIGAAYAQIDFNQGGFRGNIGYRMVYTQDVSRYTTFSTDANGNQTKTPTTTKTDYLKFLPGINLAYDFSPTFLVRGSVAEVIARPRYSDLAGSFSRNDTNLSASGGNPNLKPYQSRNYELSAEWNFKPGALLAVEYFRREISSYIVTVSTQENLYDVLLGRVQSYLVSSPVNASDTTVNGAAVNFQTPIAWGFGIQTNYTYAQDSGGTDASGNVLHLPYLSRHTVNVIPYFEKGPFLARVSWSYRTHYFTDIGRLGSVDSTDGYNQLDASASWNINKHFTIGVNMQNLLDETYYSYSGTKDAPTALYKNGRVFAGSASFKF